MLQAISRAALNSKFKLRKLDNSSIVTDLTSSIFNYSAVFESCNVVATQFVAHDFYSEKVGTRTIIVDDPEYHNVCLPRTLPIVII